MCSISREDAYVHKGGGRDDAAFEMRRDGPLLKFGAIGIGVILLLLVLSVFPAARNAHRSGACGCGNQSGGQAARGIGNSSAHGLGGLFALTTQIIEFPTYVQTVKWTKDTSEGHPINEEMGFNSKEGMEIFVDVSLSYAIEAAKARTST